MQTLLAAKEKNLEFTWSSTNDVHLRLPIRLMLFRHAPNSLFEKQLAWFIIFHRIALFQFLWEPTRKKTAYSIAWICAHYAQSATCLMFDVQRSCRLRWMFDYLHRKGAKTSLTAFTIYHLPMHWMQSGVQFYNPMNM